MSERAFRIEPTVIVGCLSCRHVGVVTAAALRRKSIKPYTPARPFRVRRRWVGRSAALFLTPHVSASSVLPVKAARTFAVKRERPLSQPFQAKAAQGSNDDRCSQQVANPHFPARESREASRQCTPASRSQKSPAGDGAPIREREEGPCHHALCSRFSHCRLPPPALEKCPPCHYCRAFIGQHARACNNLPERVADPTTFSPTKVRSAAVGAALIGVRVSKPERPE